MTIQFQINGMKFYILKTVEGYRWMPPKGTGRLCPSELKAQQDAIDWVQSQVDAEENVADIGEYWDNRREYVD